MIHFSLAVVLALASSAPAAETPAAPDALVVHVYHTNDIHGWIMERPEKGRPEASVGGAPALLALLKKDAGDKLVVDAGDWWQGTPEGAIGHGEALAAMFNAAGYDAVEVGNHDFDAGREALEALLPRFRVPVLGANVYAEDGKHVPWLKQRVIKEVGGVKFGVFGLLTTHMDKLEPPRKIAGLRFRREVDEARDQVAALKKEGADVIIALTHLGYETPDKPRFQGDQTLAREVPGIDLIVGGHSHTTLRPAWRDPVNGTLVVQAGCFLAKVGRVTMTIDRRTRRIVSDDDELIELAPARDGEDPAMKALVAERQAQVGEAFKLVVATATADLNRGFSDRESGLGSWMTDCFRAETGAEAALINGGGIRSDIPAGPVSLRSLYQVMPFDDTVATVKMKGSLLREALDHVLGSPRIAQIGGMTASYRALARKGERVAEMTVGGKPVEDDRVYSVVTLDFLAESYPEFARGEDLRQTGELARDVLRRCAEKQGAIAPPPAGRMKPLPK